MNRVQTDATNTKFLQETLAYDGVNGLKVWYNGQPDYIKEYMIDLIGVYIAELSDLQQELSGNTRDADQVLSKFKL